MGVGIMGVGKAGVGIAGVGIAGASRDMGSHSVTCYLTQVNVPHPNPSPQAGTWFTYPRGMEGLDKYASSPSNRASCYRELAIFFSLQS